MAFLLGAAVNDSVYATQAPAATGAQWVLNAGVIETFLARVLPATGPNRVISINSLYKDPHSGKSGLPGNGFDSVKAAANHIAYWLGVDIQKAGKPATDYFHCMSVQSGAVQGQTRTGRPILKTSRRQSNAVALKAFFLDLDVKEGRYASKHEALAALVDLVQRGIAPAPTMVVDSGNGLHVYWTLDQEVPAAEWTPIADGFGNHLWRSGLKLQDDTFFADSARVLRPPGTYNCKNKDAPVLTRLVGRVLSTDYTLATFTPYVGTQRPHHVAAVTRLPVPATGSAASSRADVSAIQGIGPAIAPGALAAGVSEAAAQPVDMAQIVANCAVLGDVAARGGAGDPEPFWRSALYAASFAADGREWAHKLSQGDPRYKPDETDAKFDVILAQRASQSGKLGWPTCAEFNKHSPKCAECRFVGRVKSPMQTGKDDSDLPEGYYRQAGTIWKNILVSARKDAEPMPTCVFSYGARDAFIEATPEGPAINFEAHVRHERPFRMRIPLTLVNVWRDRTLTLLGQHGITINRALAAHTQEFVVEWVRQLQSVAASAQKRDAFGWTKTRDGGRGFAVGGRIYRGDGAVEQAGSYDTVLESRYTAKGDVAVWQRAANMLIGSGRIELQTIIACAFAAPLVRYTGLSGLLVSAYSPKSGVQKSSAMQVAQAVWGHPTQAMNRIDDTGNSVANKLGHIRHLPVLWDELNMDSEKDTFAKLAFVLTQGTEKSRLTSDVQQRAGGSWATMLISASNFSVQEEMQRRAKNTTAGLNRVFEFVVRPGSPSQLTSMADASMTIGALGENYGGVGARYAAILARDDAKLAAKLSAIVHQMEKALTATPDERFWLFTAATIVLGAAIARAEGLAMFDLPALWTFLLQTIRDQRRNRVSMATDLGSAEYVADVLGRYIAYARQHNTCLETDRLAPLGLRGRQSPLALRMPSDEARRALRAPTVHLARDSGEARILKHEFHEWLIEARIPIRPVLDGLEAHAGLVSHRVTWAAGTEWSTGQTACYDITLRAGNAAANGVGNLFDWGAGPPPLPGAPIVGVTTATQPALGGAIR